MKLFEVRKGHTNRSNCEDAPFRTYNLGDTPIPLKVLGFSGGDSIPLIQIEYDGMRFWIDPLDTELVAHDEDFARQIELAVATGIPPGYKRQSIVPGEDTETENVEISHRVYADRTKSQLGWLTRDYNTTSNTIFKPAVTGNWTAMSESN